MSAITSQPPCRRVESPRRLLLVAEAAQVLSFPVALDLYYPFVELVVPAHATKFGCFHCVTLPSSLQRWLLARSRFHSRLSIARLVSSITALRNCSLYTPLALRGCHRSQNAQSRTFSCVCLDPFVKPSREPTEVHPDPGPLRRHDLRLCPTMVAT